VWVNLGSHCKDRQGLYTHNNEILRTMVGPKIRTMKDEKIA